MSTRFLDFYPPEDEVRLAELAATAERLKKQPTSEVRTLADGDPYAEAAQAHDEFAEQMQARRIRVYVSHLPRKEWRALMREHSARPDVDDDQALGVNMDTLPDALIPRSIDRERSENLPDDLDAWMESLSDVDYYDRLFLSAFSANRGTAALADPTQRLVSASRQTSDATSN